MKRKHGISLIVLVITIIVMIILAASVVITLSNTGVINKASQAVQITDEKQIEQLVNMAWADAYAGGKRTEEELKGAVEQVLAENKVDTNKIAINVTEKGVEVSDTVFEVYPLEVAFEIGPIVQLKAKVPVNYEAVYVEFINVGVITKVEEYDVVDGIKVFSFELLPQLMGQSIQATLKAKVNGNEIERNVETITIESYAKAILQKTAEELNMSETKFSKLKVLISDMLEYGATAQIYKNYNIDKLVNAGVTGKTTFVELTETDYKKEYRNDTDAARHYGNNLTFTSKVRLMAGVGGTNINNITVKIIDGNNVLTRKINDFRQDSSNTSIYIAESDCIELKDFDKVYTFEEYNGAELYAKYTYSVKSYVYAMQNKTESDGTTLTAIANMARALYNYGLSAKAYINAK